MNYTIWQMGESFDLKKMVMEAIKRYVTEHLNAPKDIQDYACGMILKVGPCSTKATIRLKDALYT